MWVGGQRHAPADFTTREVDPVRNVQEAKWAPGPVWTGAENLTLPRQQLVVFNACNTTI